MRRDLNHDQLSQLTLHIVSENLQVYQITEWLHNNNLAKKLIDLHQTAAFHGIHHLCAGLKIECQLDVLPNTYVGKIDSISSLSKDISKKLLDALRPKSARRFRKRLRGSEQKKRDQLINENSHLSQQELDDILEKHDYPPLKPGSVGKIKRKNHNPRAR